MLAFMFSINKIKQLFFYLGFILSLIPCYVNADQAINSRGPLELVKPYIPENPVILEAGGHYGEDTVKMIRFWPEATIYTFEPNPFAFDILKKITSSFPRIIISPLALYDYTGIVKFNIQQTENNDGASSILEANHVYYSDIPISVACTTLDDWEKNHNFIAIDFMWLDMEGVELYVLKKGTNLLKNVKAIYTETNFTIFRQL